MKILPGVDDPAVALVLSHLGSEHVSVESGVKREESLTEASREGSLGFNDTDFSTSDLSGVSGDEVIHSLRRGELSDRGENTVGITSQEDDVLGVSTDRGELGIWDVLKRVASSGILSDINVIIVDSLAGSIAELNVLEDSSELDSIEDFWFLFSGEIDGLSVASTFDVEDTIVGPAVLIITEKFSLGISRKGGLTSSRETEEKSDISISTFSG